MPIEPTTSLLPTPSLFYPTTSLTNTSLLIERHLTVRKQQKDIEKEAFNSRVRLKKQEMAEKRNTLQQKLQQEQASSAAQIQLRMEARASAEKSRLEECIEMSRMYNRLRKAVKDSHDDTECFEAERRRAISRKAVFEEKVQARRSHIYLMLRRLEDREGIVRHDLAQEEHEECAAIVMARARHFQKVPRKGSPRALIKELSKSAKTSSQEEPYFRAASALITPSESHSNIQLFECRRKRIAARRHEVLVQRCHAAHDLREDLRLRKEAFMSEQRALSAQLYRPNHSRRSPVEEVDTSQPAIESDMRLPSYAVKALLDMIHDM